MSNELAQSVLKLDNINYKDVVDLKTRLILLQIYQKEETTKAGLLRAPMTLESARFDNRMGRVLDIGTDAYDDKEIYPSGALCKIGDWVLFWRHDASWMTINGIDCAMLPASKVMFPTQHPELIKTDYHMGK